MSHGGRVGFAMTVERKTESGAKERGILMCSIPGHRTEVETETEVKTLHLRPTR